MLRLAEFLLILFYGGALLATGRTWLAVWRGSVRFAGLRDVTGIGDRVTLRRLFGTPGAGDLYAVSPAAVLKHRRRSGLILSDTAVHALFFGALVAATSIGSGPIAAAVACAAIVHGVVVAAAALTVLADTHRALAG